MERATVYLALGATDMRKSINGLSLLVEEQFALDLFTGNRQPVRLLQPETGYGQNPVLEQQRLLHLVEAVGGGPIPLAR